MEQLLAPLYTQHRQLDRRLDEVESEEERQRVKEDIVAYFKSVDDTLTEVAKLKEDIRALVNKYKGLATDGSDDQAPQFMGVAPVHADHIGASTYKERGWSLMALEDYSGAVQALAKALELSPGDVDAESLLGWALMSNQEYDAALIRFHNVLMHDQDNAVALTNLGYICFKKSMFGEAIEHLSRVLQMSEDKKATLYGHFYLGLVYQSRGMHKDARVFFQKTLELGPNLIEAHYELGRAEWLLGMERTALATWRNAYEANKNKAWGKRCKEMIEQWEAGEEPTPFHAAPEAGSMPRRTVMAENALMIEGE